jgi:DNA (cytosine-5)-methyltransferase 1
MTAYYNEIDNHAADWLENLIAERLIADGIVDRRSIADVQPGDLRGFIQCHFFAGIGGWSLAFRRAGIPDDRPAWSASCPCPPWSRARIWHRDSAGTNDARDLWPVLFRLIDARRPARLYGEQVSGTKALPWIGRTCGDLAGLGYSLRTDHRRARDFGAPQGRERFYFAADLVRAGRQGLVTGGSAGASRPWRWRGEEDLRAIADAPFEPGDRWPQPLVRRGDDGLPARVANLRAYGNAIDPWVAAEFISSQA